MMKKIQKKILKHLLDFLIGTIVSLISLVLVLSLAARSISGIISNHAKNFPNKFPLKISDPSVTPKPIPPKSSRGDLIDDEVNKTYRITIKEDKYTVREGDYLWQIAEAAYGDGMMMYRIMKANNITNPDQIEVGMTLKLPR